jgi:hypothetical protein
MAAMPALLDAFDDDGVIAGHDVIPPLTQTPFKPRSAAAVLTGA